MSKQGLDADKQLMHWGGAEASMGETDDVHVLAELHHPDRDSLISGAHGGLGSMDDLSGDDGDDGGPGDKNHPKSRIRKPKQSYIINGAIVKEFFHIFYRASQSGKKKRQEVNEDYRMMVPYAYQLGPLALANFVRKHFQPHYAEPIPSTTSSIYFYGISSCSSRQQAEHEFHRFLSEYLKSNVLLGTTPPLVNPLSTRANAYFAATQQQRRTYGPPPSMMVQSQQYPSPNVNVQQPVIDTEYYPSQPHMPPFDFLSSQSHYLLRVFLPDVPPSCVDMKVASSPQPAPFAPGGSSAELDAGGGGGAGGGQPLSTPQLFPTQSQTHSLHHLQTQQQVSLVGGGGSGSGSGRDASGENSPGEQQESVAAAAAVGGMKIKDEKKEKGDEKKIGGMLLDEDELAAAAEEKKGKDDEDDEDDEDGNKKLDDKGKDSLMMEAQQSEGERKEVKILDIKILAYSPMTPKEAMWTLVSFQQHPLFEESYLQLVLPKDVYINENANNVSISFSPFLTLLFEKSSADGSSPPPQTQEQNELMLGHGDDVDDLPDSERADDEDVDDLPDRVYDSHHAPTSGGGSGGSSTTLSTTTTTTTTTNTTPTISTSITNTSQTASNIGNGNGGAESGIGIGLPLSKKRRREDAMFGDAETSLKRQAIPSPSTLMMSSAGAATISTLQHQLQHLPPTAAGKRPHPSSPQMGPLGIQQHPQQHLQMHMQLPQQAQHPSLRRSSGAGVLPIQSVPSSHLQHSLHR